MARPGSPGPDQRPSTVPLASARTPELWVRIALEGTARLAVVADCEGDALRLRAYLQRPCGVDLAIAQRGRRGDGGGRVTEIAANVDAEASVLGGIIRAACLDQAAGFRIVDRLFAIGLEPDDFALPSHANLYGTIVRLRVAGLPVDPITLADELERSGAEPGVRGRLERIAHETTAFGNCEHHGRIVMREARLRRDQERRG